MTYKKTNARAFSIHLHRCMLLFIYVGFQLLMKLFFFFFVRKKNKVGEWGG